MKSYTDIPQSKKLAEILPIETVDMFYDGVQDIQKEKVYNIPINGSSITVRNGHSITKRAIKANLLLPCWSLAALLNVLSEIKPQVYTPILFPSEGKWILQFAEYGHGNVCEVTCDNPVDACVAIIESLHKLNLL
jgi:hypothetical protein